MTDETDRPFEPDLPVLDDEPDVWADEHPEATPEEIEKGNELGATIDVDDDDDNGGLG